MRTTILLLILSFSVATKLQGEPEIIEDPSSEADYFDYDRNFSKASKYDSYDKKVVYKNEGKDTKSKNEESGMKYTERYKLKSNTTQTSQSNDNKTDVDQYKQNDSKPKEDEAEQTNYKSMEKEVSKSNSTATTKITTNTVNSNINSTNTSNVRSDSNKYPDFIRFLGWPNALTSQTSAKVIEGYTSKNLPMTILDGRENNNKNLQGTQILYQKFYTKSGDDDKKVPLVSVLLLNDDLSPPYVLTLFKDGFDMISQKCSCYWIDAKEMLKMKKFPSGKRYYLQFIDTKSETPKFNGRSGYFEIQT